MVDGGAQSEASESASVVGRKRTDDVKTLEDVDFSALTFHPQVLEGLRKSGFERPSPIQLRAIPLGRCGLDLIVQAKSGTGKTCVFTIVALESLDLSSKVPQVLVLAPTREIAVQIQQVVMSIGCTFIGLKCHVFIGGLPFSADKQKLSKCHIAVGTPGRIKQLIESQLLKTGAVRLLVLDEADKLLEQGFQEQINWIYSTLPESKQMIAASATYPEALAEHVMAYMHDPTMVRLNAADPSLLGIKQFKKVLRSRPSMHLAYSVKVEHLLAFLAQVSFHQCLIFSNLQTRAENLSQLLCGHGWPSTSISGSQDQQRRLSAMSDLRASQCRILVATDLISRGIDVDKVNLVINLDVPKDYDTYLHRIGRAGRFGSHGLALTYIASAEDHEVFSRLLVRARTAVLDLPDSVPSDLVDRAAVPQAAAVPAVQEGADNSLPATAGAPAAEVIETFELKKAPSAGCHTGDADESARPVAGSGDAAVHGSTGRATRASAACCRCWDSDDDKPKVSELDAGLGLRKSDAAAATRHVGRRSRLGSGVGNPAAAAAAVWDSVAALRLGGYADDADQCARPPAGQQHEPPAAAESGAAADGGIAHALCLDAEPRAACYDALRCAIETFLDASRSASQRDGCRRALRVAPDRQAGAHVGQASAVAAATAFNPSRRSDVARVTRKVRLGAAALPEPDSDQRRSRASPTLGVPEEAASELPPSRPSRYLRGEWTSAGGVGASLGGICRGELLPDAMPPGLAGSRATTKELPCTQSAGGLSAEMVVPSQQHELCSQPATGESAGRREVPSDGSSATAAVSSSAAAMLLPRVRPLSGSRLARPAGVDDVAVNGQGSDDAAGAGSACVFSDVTATVGTSVFPTQRSNAIAHCIRFAAADMYIQSMIVSLRRNKRP